MKLSNSEIKPSLIRDALHLLARAASLVNVDMLRDGYIPSAVESTSIDEASSELSSTVSQIDLEIERLQALRERVCAQLDVNKAAGAPIRRLPPEILSVIFIRFAETAVVDARSWSQHIMYAVSRVCSAWRSIARHTPQLWTRISSQLFSGIAPPETVFTEEAALAGILPLHITHLMRDYDEYLNPLLRQLFPHAHRWQSIALDGDCETFSRLPVVDLPSLEVARLIMNERVTPDALDFLSGALNLRTLQLSIGDRIIFVNPEIHFAMPAFPALTHLSMKIDAEIDFRTETLFACLRYSSSTLTHLNLAMSVPESHIGVDSDAHAVEMRALLVLEISGYAYGLLERITTPVVNTIHVNHMGGTGIGLSMTDPFLALTTFLSRSPQPLAIKHLSLKDVQPNAAHPESVLQFLERLDELEEMEIGIMRHKSSVFTERVVERLTCSDDRVPLLPSLAKMTLMFQYCNLPMQFENYLRGMCGSRETARTCALRPIAALKSMFVLAT